MKNGLLIPLFLLSFMSSTFGNPIAMAVYQLDDKSRSLDIEQVSKSTQFSRIEDIGTLNFGISICNYWLKIVVKNTEPNATYKLVISSIVPDTIEVYALSEGIFKKELIGEAIPTRERFLNYYFKPTDNETVLYLKITGDGQPIAIPLSIIRSDIGDDVGIKAILFSGVLYGIVCLILIINLVLYINTYERLYLYFFIFNIFAAGCVLYFDGFVKLLFIPNSIYWNNQFVIINLCGSFIMNNYYFHEFLKIKDHQPALTKFFNYINLAFFAIGCLSFWHPTGFNLYIQFNLVMTTAEAILLFFSLVMVRQKEKEYFVVQLVSIGLIIVFGSIVQLYFFGLLPINALTKNAMNCMLLPLILIQTFALSKRFTILTNERLTLQTTLLAASEQYSQSLISTLENERKRLSSEFHDSIGQNLLVIRNRVLLMLKQTQTNGQKEKLDGLAAITSETLDEIRAISQNLRPTTLDTIGLTASLNNMLERLKRSTEIKINFVCPQSIDESIDKELEINIYRILQELMNNVLKHSKAHQTTVTITQDVHQLLIQVEDDGVGFDTQTRAINSTSNGFTSIKERVKILRGDITIVSEKQKGTVIDVTIPIVIHHS
jgi:two-component system, sensor histidine kinase LadS